MSNITWTFIYSLIFQDPRPVITYEFLYHVRVCTHFDLFTTICFKGFKQALGPYLVSLGRGSNREVMGDR
jgi:hypothetical protein